MYRKNHNYWYDMAKEEAAQAFNADPAWNPTKMTEKQIRKQIQDVHLLEVLGWHDTDEDGRTSWKFSAGTTPMRMVGPRECSPGMRILDCGSAELRDC